MLVVTVQKGRAMMRSLLAGTAVALIGMAGCVKPEPVIYRVSLGMSEQRMMEALGPPLSVRGDGQGKTFEYQTWVTNMHGRPVHRHDWHVHVSSEGLVDAYGPNRELAPLRQS